MKVKVQILVITTAAMLLIMAEPAAARRIDLLEAFRLAEEHDPLIAAARQQQLARLEQLPQARSLLFPQIDASANANRVWENLEFDNFNGTTGAPPNGAQPNGGFPLETMEGTTSYTTANIGVNLRQAIFRQDAFVALRQARLIEGQAEIAFLAARQQLGLRVAEAYFEVVEAEDTVRTFEAELRAVESEKGRAQRRYELGVGGIIEVNDVEARHAATRANLLQANSQLRLAIETLRRTVNVPVTGVAGLSPGFRAATPRPEDPGVWVERAEQVSLEVLTAEMSLDIARAGVDLARAERYPRLDLVVGIMRDYQGENPLTGGIGIEADRASIGIQLTLPIFTGGSITAGIRESIAQREAGAHLVSDARRNAALAAETAYIAAESAMEQTGALTEALQAVQLAEESTKRGLELGQRTTLDLLNIQRERFEVERSLATARYQYLLAYLHLLAFTGEQIDEAVETVNNLMKGEDK
jgi:outer membrane protein